MDRYNQFYARRSKRKMLDIRISECDSQNSYVKKLKDAELGDQEVDRDYDWLLIDLNKTNGKTNEVENENENGDEVEDVDVDENDKDPQYCLFLENLTEHGKSYKLKVSQNDEEPCFLYYEEQDNSDSCDDLQTCIDDSGDEVTFSEDNQKAKGRWNERNDKISTKKEVSRRKKISNDKSIEQPHRGMISDPSYQMFLNGVVKEEKVVECEKNVTTSDADSDIVIWRNAQNHREINNIQLADKEPSLREKLMHMLKLPYNEKEHEELSEYIEQKKPICRLLPLRGRSISSALGGVKKSVLDCGPGSFRRMLNTARNDPHKALNLLRMFCFWLEHVPNEDVFEPWKDKHILKVRPSEKKALN